MDSRKIDIAIGVTGAQQAREALRSVSQQADELARKNGGGGGGGSIFDRLAAGAKGIRREDRMSGETALGGFLNRGIGGAADAGLNMIGLSIPAMLIEFGGRELKALAEQAVNLRKEMREGSVGAGDIVEKMGEAVPIFGDVVSSGRAIHELLSGSKYQIELINQEAKLTTALFDAQEKRATGIRKILQDIAADRRKMQGETAIAGIDDPFEKAMLQARQKRSQETADDSTDKDAKIAAARKMRKDEADAAQALADNLRKQFEEKFSASPEANPNDVSFGWLPGAASYRANFLKEAPAVIAAERHAAEIRRKAYGEVNAIKTGFAGKAGDEDAGFSADVAKAMRERREKELKDADTAIEKRKSQQEEIDRGVTSRLEERRRDELRKIEEFENERRDLLHATSDARVKALEFAGKTEEAARARITADTLARMMAANGIDERTAIAQAAAFDLINSQRDVVSNSGRAAPGNSNADRFTTGLSDQILGRTNGSDFQAQQQKDLQRVAKAMEDFLMLYKQQINKPSYEGIPLGAVGGP